MIRLPDLRRPGVFFKIKNAKSIVAGCRLEHCAICEFLKRAMREQANATLPVPETGFEVIECE